MIREYPKDCTGTDSIRKPTMKAAMDPPGDRDFFLQPCPASTVASTNGITGREVMLDNENRDQERDALVLRGRFQISINCSHASQIRKSRLGKSMFRRHLLSHVLLNPQSPPAVRFVPLYV